MLLRRLRYIARVDLVYQVRQLLLIQEILTGYGVGIAFGSGILVLQSYFGSHLSAAAGLTSAGGSVGK